MKEQERIKKKVRKIVSRYLKTSSYITRQNLEAVRKKNIAHDFTKSR